VTDTILAFLQTAAPATESIPGWASLGVGGVLAMAMFYFYRLDRKASEERLNGVIKDFRSIIEANTAAMTSLREAVREKD
jgi:hypothetical protein